MSKSPEEIFQKALKLFYLENGAHRKQSVALFKQAARLEHPMSMYALATWYLFGVHGVRKNFKKAYPLLYAAATAGVPVAQYDLAISYETGKGTEKSPQKAFYWYKKAVDSGDAEALFELARCYYWEIGVTKQQQKSLLYYRKAANQGNLEAQMTLGQMYLTGDLVRKNRRAATRWFNKAFLGLRQIVNSKSGNLTPIEKYCLGSLYEKGDGTRPNIRWAKYWYTKASDEGNHLAKKALKEIL